MCLELVRGSFSWEFGGRSGLGPFFWGGLLRDIFQPSEKVVVRGGGVRMDFHFALSRRGGRWLGRGPCPGGYGGAQGEGVMG